MATPHIAAIVGLLFLLASALDKGQTRSIAQGHVVRPERLFEAGAAIDHQRGNPKDGDPTHEATTADMPGLTAAASHCAIASDPTYGTTPANPIKLGGVLHPAWREVVYLSALRGPSGQGLHFKRQGSTPQGDAILDVYAIDYPGIPAPVTLYVDGYHWDPPIAPAGWLCGKEVRLAAAGPDPVTSQKNLMALAVSLGQHAVTPISLDADGSARHGVVFDHVRMVALAAHAAARAGTPLDPQALPDDLKRPRVAIVAFPTTCRGRAVPPQSISLVDSQGDGPRALRTARGEEIGDVVRGFHAPAGALAVIFDVPWLFEDARTTVHYEEACGSESPAATFSVKVEEGGATRNVPGVVPPGVTLPDGGAVVLVQVFFDADGTTRFPTYVDGPLELRDAAIEAAGAWRLRPLQLNGAPAFDFVILPIEFWK